MTYILNVNPFYEIDINIYKTIIISQISSLLNGILFSLDFGQYARYAYFSNSFRIAQNNFWGVQERSNDWKYVVPCKSINKDTQMLLILLCKMLLWVITFVSNSRLNLSINQIFSIKHFIVYCL